MKKLLSACLAVLMLLSSLSIMTSAALNLYQDIDKDDTYTVGDVNGDKAEPNAKDSNLIKCYILKKNLGEENFVEDAADINADGVINSKDSYLLKSIIAGTKTPADFGDDQQIYKLTIGGVDISEFSIYAPEPEGSDNNATYSAELMRKYIRVATGVDLEVKTGTPEGHAIVFNSIPRISEVDPDKRDELTESELEKYAYGEKLGTDGYQYKVENGSLYVYGTYRGNMYATYEILENYLGYRFYDRNHTFIYKSRTVDIPEGLDSGIFEPALKFRYCGAYVKGTNAQVYYFPSRMNGTQIYDSYDEKYGTLYGPQFINAHSYGYYWRMNLGEMPADDGETSLSDRYKAKVDDGEKKWKAADMSEYSWQPCASSEEDYDKLFNGMIDTITMISEGWGSAVYDFTGVAKKYVQDGQKSMSFSLCDNESYCTCRKCRSKSNTEGYSGVYLELANRAVRDLQEYENGKYAGMRIHCILYNHDIPQTVRPDKNLIIFFCGQGCNNHILNSEDCGDCMGQKPKKNNNKDTNKSLRAWSDMCAETGAEMWFWYYGVQYSYVLVDLPNILNIYHDFKYLYEEYNIQGIYYEGGEREYSFGKLKEYLAMKMMWEPDMSYEKYTDYMKEYLYMYYGDGYEQLYQFILMQDESAKNCGTCFISNFDRPGDMHSRNYIRTHYEEMRQLIVDALDLADKKEYKDRLKTMLYCFDFLGLSYVYYDVYKGEKATAETKALFEQRYTDMFNHLTTAEWAAADEKKYHGLQAYDNNVLFFLPSEINFDICPIMQVYATFTYDKEGKLIRIDPAASNRTAINNLFLNGTTPVINDDASKKDENGNSIPVYNDGIPEPTTVKFGNMAINY